MVAWFRVSLVATRASPLILPSGRPKTALHTPECVLDAVGCYALPLGWNCSLSRTPPVSLSRRAYVGDGKHFKPFWNILFSVFHHYPKSVWRPLHACVFVCAAEQRVSSTTQSRLTRVFSEVRLSCVASLHCCGMQRVVFEVPNAVHAFQRSILKVEHTWSGERLEDCEDAINLHSITRPCQLLTSSRYRACPRRCKTVRPPLGAGPSKRLCRSPITKPTGSPSRPCLPHQGEFSSSKDFLSVE